MQKATPIILVLILAVTATFFSFRSKKDGFTSTAPAELTISAASPRDEDDAEEAKPLPVAAETNVTPEPWPQASSDIAPDAGATFGTLANGFRYIIYPNAEPPKRVSLRLHIASGSLMEADNQQGLSHFLEHMVFNGSKDFTSEELVPKMQRLGIGFGAHVNAYTSFDETVYMLDLPDLSADTMKLGFTVMRDFGDGALLSADEIEKERGVILSEKVSRDTVESRIMEQQFNKLLPDSLVAKRFPIGIEDVIKTAPRERFTDLYSRFYTPARMTFVVVGDIDAKEMQATIEKTFSSMTNPKDAGKNPDLGPIKQPEGIVTSVFADKEISSTDVSLMMVRPFEVKADTAANRSADMTLDIAHSILTRRFERISKIEGSAIASGSASNSNVFNYMEIGSIDVTATDDRWQEAVPVVEQEFQRALEYGFTDAELAEAKSNLLNAYQQAVKQKATRKSESIASALAKSTNDQTVFSDPVTDLELATKALDSIDIKQVHDAFKTFWDAPGYHLILTTKEKPANAEKELAALFEDSRGKPVTAPTARALQPFGYADFGKPGTVTSRKEVKDLGVTQLVLSNQVRVNLKPTDFEKGKIRLLARIGSGKLTQPKDSPMLDVFATAVFEGGGLGKHSNDDLQEILAGKNVSSSLTIGEDMFALGGSTTPADFTTEVRLMCASLTDPGYRTEALWQFQKAIPMMYQQLKHTAAGPQQEMDAWLHGNDSRFAVAPVEKMSAYTIDDAKKWLTPELTKGYLELTIVGDFEIDKILPDLLATFGALPTRAPSAPPLADARKVLFPNAPAAKTFTYDSKIPQGIAMSLWKTAGIRNNQKETRRLNILSSIYGDRLREEIREKLGASYSPNAGASGSDALDGFGYVIGESIGKPEDLELLLKTMRDLADTLSTKGATDDELDRALKPVLSQLAKSVRDNSYWLATVLSQSQADPQRLDLARSRDADYKSISLKEINALAKKYLAAQNALQVAIKPAE
ncbi:MAG: insulinase family protein [Luteolibacter sp.]|uniref:M16 family metallopeptidase n=1 Tax=Luteolibacter sp. TaxID=1962973 RepID=UPI0032668D69